MFVEPNLFVFVQTFQTTKGYSRKTGFFSPEFENPKCFVCKKTVANINRQTCSDECKKKYECETGKLHTFINFQKTVIMRRIPKDELVLLLKAKYFNAQVP